MQGFGFVWQISSKSTGLDKATDPSSLTFINSRLDACRLNFLGTPGNENNWVKSTSRVSTRVLSLTATKTCLIPFFCSTRIVGIKALEVHAKIHNQESIIFGLEIILRNILISIKKIFLKIKRKYSIFFPKKALGPYRLLEKTLSRKIYFLKNDTFLRHSVFINLKKYFFDFRSLQKKLNDFRRAF